VSAALLVAAAWFGASPPGASAATPPAIPISVAHYDSSTLAEYHQKWSNM
jgi:hypothetical protein